MSPTKSKAATITGVVLALVTVLADQTSIAAISVLAGPALAAKINTALTSVGVLVAALGRALLDADGNGTPDILEGGR